jgi:hypothetical protein
MKSRLIITGALGMAGERVLYERLHFDIVEQVHIIDRKHCGYISSLISLVFVKD